jgi:hypothetical protein
MKIIMGFQYINYFGRKAFECREKSSVMVTKAVITFVTEVTASLFLLVNDLARFLLKLHHSGQDEDYSGVPIH